jgi:hypothetical protein
MVGDGTRGFAVFAHARPVPGPDVWVTGRDADKRRTVSK